MKEKDIHKSLVNNGLTGINLLTIPILGIVNNCRITSYNVCYTKLLRNLSDVAIYFWVPVD